MKPRLFIGSSTEGLAIANAIQKGLWRAAEVTVWTQDVFAPSKGTLEALLEHLESEDFGLFVFSPDDIAHIRGEANQVVRDNVLFELGIVIGRLGRERAFFVVPEKAAEPFRVPTDLAGITPLYYEHGRSDGNIAASVGPACTDVVQVVMKLGGRSRATDVSAAVQPPSATKPTESLVSEASVSASADTQGTGTDAEHESKWGWFVAFQDADFAKAIELLEKRIAGVEDIEEKRDLIAWLGRLNYKLDPVRGAEMLEKAIADAPTNPDAYSHLASMYLSDDRIAEGLAVADRGLKHAGDQSFLVLLKARALRKQDGPSAAIDYLRPHVTSGDDLTFFTELAGLYEQLQDYERARITLDAAVRRFPRNEVVAKLFAAILEEHFDKKLALVPRNLLVELDAKSPEHLTYRGNLLLELGLNDLAMCDYKKANEFADSKQDWILANIGNLYRNVGMFSDAIEFFQAALKLSPGDKYAHERLSYALDGKSKEEEKLKQLRKDARAELTTMRQTDLKLDPPAI